MGIALLFFFTAVYKLLDLIEADNFQLDLKIFVYFFPLLMLISDEISSTVNICMSRT
jgi:hypothetical protein